jgi:hypothetical protein
VPLLSIVGIGLAAGSLAGLLMSESTGLFGFMETGYRPAIELSVALDVATIVFQRACIRLAREFMLERGRIAGSAPEIGGEFFSAGDAIVLIQNDGRLGVVNGESPSCTTATRSRGRRTSPAACGR